MKIATSMLFLAALAVAGCEKKDTTTPDDATNAETPAATETPASDAAAETPAAEEAPAEGEGEAPAAEG